MDGSQEQGLKFKINLTDYLDTGLFDHRITRAKIRAFLKAKEFNHFVIRVPRSMLRPEAREISVDLSKTHLKRATEKWN